MGKFLKYEDSNARTLIVNMANKTVKRPKRQITKADLLGAIVKIEDMDVPGEAVVVSVIDAGLMYTFYTIFAGSILSGSYTKNTDTFNLGNDVYTNIFVDEFGREEKYI